MKLLSLAKDGGPKSRVWGYWLIEWKWLFSICLLHFKDGSRETYHSHAFNSISWVLHGKLKEYTLIKAKGKWGLSKIVTYTPSWKPIITPRSQMHKVNSDGNTFVITFRGRWAKFWMEYCKKTGKEITLTTGRKVVEPDCTRCGGSSEVFAGAAFGDCPECRG